MELRRRAAVRARRRRGPDRPDRVRARVHDREQPGREAARAADVSRSSSAWPAAAACRASATSTGRCSCTASSGVENFGEIPVDGTIVSTTRVVGIYDKGSGALAVHGDRVEVQGQRQARVQHAVRRVHPRRRRFRREPRRRAPGPAEDPGHEARPRGDVRDACRPGAALPAERRPQPAALGPGVREARRLPDGRSSTACAPTASPAARCSTRCAARTRPSSRSWTRASRSR